MAADNRKRDSSNDLETPRAEVGAASGISDMRVDPDALEALLADARRENARLASALEAERTRVAELVKDRELTRRTMQLWATALEQLGAGTDMLADEVAKAMRR